MIDLHMHTKYSDGTDTVIDLLKKANEINLEMISITDHDEVGAYLELDSIDINKYFSGKIIRGAELRSVYRGRAIEILGYGIDVKRIMDSKYITNVSGSKREEECLEILKNVGRKIGLKFDESIRIGKPHAFASGTFSREIFSHPENRSIIEEYGLVSEDGKNDFYRKGQSNPDSVFYIDESDHVFNPEVIINEIHEAGGLAFLAHPLVYHFENKLETICAFVKEYDIDGIECYHSLFSDEEIRGLLEICNKYNKYVSGGSDYHGTNKTDIELGVGRGNLKITYDMVSDWIDKVV